MAKPLLSVQLYSVRDALKEDFSGALARLAAIGYTAVEPFDFGRNTDALASELTALGLTAPTGHAALLREDQDPIFEAAQRLGMSTVIDPYVPPERWASSADIEATAEALNSAAKKAKEYGLQVGYHNHWWELRADFDGVSGLETLARRLDPAVVLEVDAYWAGVGGVLPQDLLKSLGQRVHFLHLKDGPLTEVTKDQLPAGSGEMDFGQVIAATPALKVGVVEFDDYSGDIFDGLTTSYEFFTQGGQFRTQEKRA